MEKRVLLAVGLSVAVLIGFNALFPPVKRPTAGGHERARHSRRSVGQRAPRHPQLLRTSSAGARRQPRAVGAGSARCPDARRRHRRTPDRRRERGRPGDVLDTRRSAHQLAAEALCGEWRTTGSDSARMRPRDRRNRSRWSPTTRRVNDALGQALFKPSAESLDATSAPATLTLEYPRRQRPVGDARNSRSRRRSRTKSSSRRT